MPCPLDAGNTTDRFPMPGSIIRGIRAIRGPFLSVPQFDNTARLGNKATNSSTMRIDMMHPQGTLSSLGVAGFPKLPDERRPPQSRLARRNKPITIDTECQNWSGPSRRKPLPMPPRLASNLPLQRILSARCGRAACRRPPSSISPDFDLVAMAGRGSFRRGLASS